jgi:hypothetical protein
MSSHVIKKFIEKDKRKRDSLAGGSIYGVT